MPKKTITYRLMSAEENEREFYGIMGKFFALNIYSREIGYIIRDDKDRMWVVAMISNTVIGFGSFSVDKNNIGRIHDSWVDKKYRGKDVYRTILNLRMNWFKDHKVEQVKAVIPPHLISRFESIGFVTEKLNGKYAQMNGTPREWVK